RRFIQARGLLVYAIVARRNISAAARIAVSAAHRLLRNLYSLARHSPIDESARAETHQLRGADHRMHRRAPLWRPPGSAHSISQPGIIIRAPRRSFCRSAASLPASAAASAWAE